MLVIDLLAEPQILAAIERGDLDNLPGKGKPLKLDDDSLVPEPLRAGYRLLKNAGCLPPELALHQEIRTIEQLLAACDAGKSLSDESRELEVQLTYLKTRLAMLGHDVSPLWLEQQYRDKLSRRLARTDDTID